MGPGRSRGPCATEQTVAAGFIVLAPDGEAEVPLAKTQPSLAFGTAIEVRPLKATPWSVLTAAQYLTGKEENPSAEAATSPG